MDATKDISLKIPTVRVVHDLQRQLLEMTSFLRVVNNYYKKKANLHLSEDYLNQKDSFNFPDSIILFEAWMYLGIRALFPRVVLQFQFPGFLRGERIRNIFQFIFSTSRGFGFPIYFGPEFYHYRFKLAKIFDPLLKWVYTVSHRANQAIVVGNKRLKSKRHHPGEFESVIISEYDTNEYKGIDTILHGYFKNTAKPLGKFSSLGDLLQNSTFNYSIGDHAMKIEKNGAKIILNLRLINHDTIVKNYDIDFHSYVRALLNTNKLLNQKIEFYQEKRNNLISNLKKIDKFKFRLERSKHSAKEFARISQKLSKKYPIIDRYDHYKTLLEKIRVMLFTTPIYMHTIHNSKEYYNYLPLLKIERNNSFKFKHESTNSILLSYIKNYEKKHKFNFEEEEVVHKLKQLQDNMGKMWLSFKEKQFNFALEKLNELSCLVIDDKNYMKKVDELLDTLLPIIAIYEIFNRPLFESVYPESIPQIKRPGNYIARFIASKYNPIGTNLMKLFNRLAFQNWSYFILKKGLNRKEFFNYLLRLPIWKHIPAYVKERILKQNS
ncbi:MAG: hypothetical protein ACFE9Q_11470 [Candidatus Hodarchaeota archaeon]